MHVGPRNCGQASRIVQTADEVEWCALKCILMICNAAVSDNRLEVSKDKVKVLKSDIGY